MFGRCFTCRNNYNTMSECPSATRNRAELIYQSRYLPSTEETIVFSVLEAVANVAGGSPADLDEPLYESVDPEALEKLVQSFSESANNSVSFDFCGFRIIIYGDGTIDVYGENEPARVGGV